MIDLIAEPARASLGVQALLVLGASTGQMSSLLADKAGGKLELVAVLAQLLAVLGRVFEGSTAVAHADARGLFTVLGTVACLAAGEADRAVTALLLAPQTTLLGLVCLV